MLKVINNSIVLLVSLYFPPEINGGSTGSWNRAMTFHKLGYSVFVLTAFPAYPSGKVADPKYRGKLFYVERTEHFEILRIRLLPIQHGGYLKRLIIFTNFLFLTLFYMLKVMKTVGRIDIVYARLPVLFSSITGFVYSLFSRSFFIYEAPDLWPEELVVFRTPLLPLITSIGRVAAKISYSLPDTIITVSNMAANFIRKEYEPKGSVYGLPVGVDHRKFLKFSKDSSRHELIKNTVISFTLQNRFIILYSGLLSSAQRVESLLYAAVKLKEDREIAILIVGEGPEKPKLQLLKKEYDLENLYILPSQPKEYMPYIISAADICTVLLSPEPIFDIALPTKFYEYLACGKPIVGICKGELADIINRYNIGRPIAYGDIDTFVSTIKEFKNCPDLMSLIEKNSYLALQKFSLDNISILLSNILSKEMGL